MAHEHGVSEIERFDERGEIVGVGVHVVSVPWLARSAVTATVMGDRAEALGSHEDHLLVSRLGVERPAMAEDDGLTPAQS
ncbi:MAG: hypothetical protein QOD01_2879 [Actinomycetota bacterium]|jgi:hypothetical protein|nr:hypothetical protein [Actinomycetota bacterium]